MITGTSSLAPPRTLAAYRVDTPFGVFTVIAAGDVVRAAGFTADATRLAQFAGIDPEAVATCRWNHPAIDAVRAYVAGNTRAVERVKVTDRPDTAPFIRSARLALRSIAPGTTLTYTELAAAAGNRRAVRAAGTACATNPVALFVPCHRVVRADGSLGEYLYGVEVKRALLAHERPGGPVRSA